MRKRHFELFSTYKFFSIVDGSADSSEKLTLVEIEQNEIVIEAELARSIKLLRIQDPMMIEDLLNHVAESGSAHVNLCDDDILAMVTKYVEQGNDSELLEEETPQISKKAKLSALSVAINMLDITIPSQYAAAEVLRDDQHQIRSSGEKQTTLDSWIVKPL